jgi:glycosyltransferase involved in cell wall biosynthesis
MNVEPDVVGWAIEPDDWPKGQSKGYVLWNKTRADQVCNPTPAMHLAHACPDVKFVSTFGDISDNVVIIGRQTYQSMRTVVLGASVYLATTKETFGIGTLEAMCAGVPVLGYDWGGTSELIDHGMTGYLVQPGDIAGLKRGLEYCLEHRDILGENARVVAQGFTWNGVAADIAAIYDAAFAEKLEQQSGIKVSVVIPCHNYGRYVGDAIESVFEQETSFSYELIVVNDASTDNSAAVIQRLEADSPIPMGVVHVKDSAVGVANARNAGVRRAQGQYVVCLDADDKLGAYTFLQTLAEELDLDRALGITFTGLQFIDEDGNIGGKSGWPSGYNFDMQAEGHNQVPTCCMFRKEAWERAGGYKSMFEPAEDANLWLTIGSLGYKGKQAVDYGWFHYRLHSQSLSSSIREGKSAEPDWRMGFPWTVDGKRPFASDGRPFPNPHSWAVRNYDAPKVSVIIPVGPGHEYIIRQALDSIKAQTERFWEAIVVNDSGAEMDLTAYPWAREYKTSARGGMGAAHARNVGIEMASAPLIAFLDADDMFMPDFLTKTIRAYSRTGAYIYTDWISQTKSGQFENHDTLDFVVGDVFRKTSTHSINILLPTDWAKAVGGFDESMDTWEDVDFFMKLAASGYCGHRVAEPLTLYRYSTGTLRELSMPRVPELKDFLSTRYRDYMTGDKMCSCDQTVQPQPMVVPPDMGGSPSGDFGTAIRVEYTGERVPMSPTTLKGASTGASYGRRGKGEVFLIWKRDFDAMTGMFREVNEVIPQIRPTITPPPPASLWAGTV